MKYLLDGEETSRLLFRPLRLDDFDAWLPFYQNPLSTQHWVGGSQIPKTACSEDFERTFYRYQNNLGGKNALISKKTGELIGQCGLLKQTVDGIEELEIGYSILPEFWKRGYATEAAQHCKYYAFKHQLSESLISIISLENKGSQKVALNNGMHIDKTTTYSNNPVYIYRVTALF